MGTPAAGVLTEVPFGPNTMVAEYFYTERETLTVCETNALCKCSLSRRFSPLLPYNQVTHNLWQTSSLADLLFAIVSP